MYRIIILFILSGFVVTVHAQNFSIEVTCLPNEMPLNNYDTLYSHQCVIELNDTINIDSIHLKIGNTYQGSEVMEYSLAFDKTTFLPKGVSYYRRKNRITLSLGNHLMNDFFYEVYLKDTLNNNSAIQYWNNVTN